MLNLLNGKPLSASCQFIQIQVRIHEATHVVPGMLILAYTSISLSNVP